MRQNIAFSTKKYEKKILGEDMLPPQTLPPVGRGIPLPTPHPPRRLRHLDLSRSKSLGTPLMRILKVWRHIRDQTLPVVAYAKLHADPIWNDGALGFLKERPQSEQEAE